MNDNQCIFCKSTDNTFTSIEHIFPESLGNKEKILPKGIVCDKCNNGILANLDNELVDFGVIKFFRTLNGVENKKGKIPITNLNNIKIENHNKTGVKINLLNNKNIYNQTDKGFELDFLVKMDTSQLKLLSRALYKIVLELMVLDHSKNFVLTSRFDEIRDIILNKKDFNGYILIGSDKDNINGLTYYLKKDKNNKDIILIDFKYMLFRIISEMEQRYIPLDNKFKINNYTLLKF